jgi:hypothetical protein
MTETSFARRVCGTSGCGALVALLLSPGFLAAAADPPTEPLRAAITGSVSDREGRPIPRASVMIWTAAPKRGYSTYCPSCYADCGKRAVTDAKGKFSFERVDPSLRFNLLVVRQGFAPLDVQKVEPFGNPVAARLLPRVLPSDPLQVVSGRIVGPNGEPAADAVVDPEFVSWKREDGTSDAIWGHGEGLDPLAVSNDQGEFEVTFKRPALKMNLCVYARGMAPKWFELPTGSDRHTLRLQRGATIRGRLVQFGKPIADAEMGLIAKDRGMIGFFPEARIATQSAGRFEFTNVAVPNNWFLYAKMDSIASRGATVPVSCHTIDGDDIDIGDIHVMPGHRVRGRVILTDGKRIADGMQFRIDSQEAWDSQAVSLRPDGRFEFQNVPTGDYSLSASVQGYHMSEKNPNLSGSTIDGRIAADLDDFIILLDPGKGACGIGRFREGKPLESAPPP